MEPPSPNRQDDEESPLLHGSGINRSRRYINPQININSQPEPEASSFLQRNVGTIIFLTLAVVGSIIAGTLASGVNDTEPDVPTTPAPINCCFDGGISSSNPIATAAGMAILKKGGNAIDAFIAMQAVLTVVEPYYSGIGGGSVLMFHNAINGTTHNVDGREEAPTNIRGNPTNTVGGGVVATPGTLAVMEYAYNKWASGNLTWSDLLQPAITCAREGFPLDQNAINLIETFRPNLEQFPSSVELFLQFDMKPGFVLKNPDLAQTFELIAVDGAKVFYNGDLTASIIKAVVNDSVYAGQIGAADFSSYKAVEREPIKMNYRGTEIYGPALPSSAGITLAQTLNILEGFELKPSNYLNNSQTLHKLYDSLTLAFADRSNYLADSDWELVPVDALLTKKYATERRTFMSPHKAISKVSPGVPDDNIARMIDRSRRTVQNQKHTTHFSIIDKNHNVVSCTSSLQNTFGNGQVVPGRGFFLNNQLNDFSDFLPNDAEGGKRQRRTALGDDASSLGGKRPLSSMSPLIAFRNKKPFLALGTPGGWKTIGFVSSVLVNVIDFNLPLQEAIAQPRLATSNEGFWLLEEPLFSDPSLQIKLQELGFNNIKRLHTNEAGVVTAVMIIEDKTIVSAADKGRLTSSSAATF